MRVPNHSILRAAACLSALLAVAGCSSSDSRAAAALGEYQAAAASNNMLAARQALLKLVRAKDDVADYWAELGKVQASMGAYGDAYYAFTRAYELDRSNPDLIRALAELALRGGDVGQAQSRAEELEIVSPGDPWVKLVKGWAAFSERRFDEALAASDSLLATSPFDPSAKILKARALIGLNREDDAIKLLTEQVRVQRNDSGSLALLAKIYQGRGDWTKVAEQARRINALAPNDRNNSLLLIEAAFRSGSVGEARRVSLGLLRPDAEPSLVSSVLDIWADLWDSRQRVDDARALAAAAASSDSKLIYARFLNRAGNPGDAIRIASPMATLPVRAESAEANAVLADALARTGNASAAKQRFDAVLAFDPGNATALRGRSELELQTGNAKAAIVDGQKLVTVVPDSSDGRLLLARAYSAAGEKDWAQRTLWTAFQDIPADDMIFTALAVTRKGDPEAMNELRAEFERQRANQLGRGLL